MELKPGKFCPLLKEDCLQLGCHWFIQVRGTNPQTGKDIDEWGCAISWLPVLLIENAQQTRQVGAATESFRNEMVRATAATTEMFSALTTPTTEIKTIAHKGD